MVLKLETDGTSSYRYKKTEFWRGITQYHLYPTSFSTQYYRTKKKEEKRTLQPKKPPPNQCACKVNIHIYPKLGILVTSLLLPHYQKCLFGHGWGSSPASSREPASAWPALHRTGWGRCCWGWPEAQIWNPKTPEKKCLQLSSDFPPSPTPPSLYFVQLGTGLWIYGLILPWSMTGSPGGLKGDHIKIYNLVSGLD